jgi:glycosyltransferase involved in cell wall biosynthesis
MSSASKGLRFALVTTFYPPYHFGGDGHMVRRLAHALAARGNTVDVIHDVDAFSMLAGRRNPGPVTEPDGVRVHPLRSRLGSLSCLATQQFGRPVVHGRKIRRILSEGFDVIHFHNISLVGGPGILACGDAIKLYTTHEHWLVCPSHILWRHNRELCTGRQCVRCVLRHYRPPQLWRSTGLLESMCHHVDAFLIPSQFCADKHREFGFKREMRILPNFLPDVPPIDGHQCNGVGADRPYFLFAGRLEHIKGLQDVIPIFSANSPADLKIAGAGRFESELRKLAGGCSAVQFLGHQTQEQLRALYRHARAVVLPSICFEVFPMVVLEAFREGTPVIARRLGPYPEIIAQSQGGLLFSCRQELEDHVSLLTRNGEYARRLGSAGRAAFELNWSESAVMERYFDVIHSISRKRQATRH